MRDAPSAKSVGTQDCRPSALRERPDYRRCRARRQATTGVAPEGIPSCDMRDRGRETACCTTFFCPGDWQGVVVAAAASSSLPPV